MFPLDCAATGAAERHSTQPGAGRFAGPRHMRRWTGTTRHNWIGLPAGTVIGLAGAAAAQGTLRVGIRAADIPLTTGEADQGDLSRLPDLPWNAIRVRKAANLTVDRGAMGGLPGGLMIPAKGFLPPSSQWFGKPSFDVRHDPEAAKTLLAGACCCMSPRPRRPRRCR